MEKQELAKKIAAFSSDDNLGKLYSALIEAMPEIVEYLKYLNDHRAEKDLTF